MQITIIGTGRVAQVLAPAIAAAGHDVTLGSRNPDAVSDAPVPVLPRAEAVAAAELVINAVAGAQAHEAFVEIGADALAGKTVLDLGNAITDAFELVYPNSSLAEKLQESLADAHVVKALNTFAAPLMVAPETIAASTAFIAGDDADAKATVAGLLGDLGWSDDSIVDLGPVTAARGLEHYFLLFAAIWQATGSPVFNVRLVTPSADA